MTKKKKTTNKDLTKLSFEQALKQLNDVVDHIEQGDVALADSIEKYEKGMNLIKHCRSILQQAEKRIEKIAEENKVQLSDEVDEDDSEYDDDPELF